MGRTEFTWHEFLLMFVIFDDFYFFSFENDVLIVSAEFCAPRGAERDAQSRISLMKT